MNTHEEVFKGILKIPYNPNAKPNETLVFKHYDPHEIVLGKPMKEWLRFSVVFWHTFRGSGLDPFGAPTLQYPWSRADTMQDAKFRMQAAFEFFTKLGVEYYCFHDRDISPEGSSIEETNANLDEITDLALELQNRTGVKLLWATCNLFSHPRYMNGAATSNDLNVYAYAGAQLKKGLEVAKKLGALNYVFWGGREGYHSLLNTKIMTELNNMANFFKMAVAYKKKIGFTGQFLIEPKPKEPTRHQYDYDAMTVIAFLKHFKLENDFKLNIEPNHTTLAGHPHEHDVVMAANFNLLGSIDSNTGSPDMGWDTDQFPMSVRDTTAIMRVVIQQKGLQPGGLNFDCKVRRESTRLEDIFIAHIGAMDAFARGLKAAAKMHEDQIMHNLIENRYATFKSSLGLKVQNGEASLEDLEKHAKENDNPIPESGQQEHFESVFNAYL